MNGGIKRERISVANHCCPIFFSAVHVCVCVSSLSVAWTSENPPANVPSSLSTESKVALSKPNSPLVEGENRRLRGELSKHLSTTQQIHLQQHTRTRTRSQITMFNKPLVSEYVLLFLRLLFILAIASQLTRMVGTVSDLACAAQPACRTPA